MQPDHLDVLHVCQNISDVIVPERFRENHIFRICIAVMLIPFNFSNQLSLHLSNPHSYIIAAHRPHDAQARFPVLQPREDGPFLAFCCPCQL
jgi:hypothetical protein